jgi:hypothetical protein
MKQDARIADSRFGAWLALIVLGFAYVSVVLCGRSNPFVSRYDRYSDLVTLVGLAPFFYFLGPRHNFPRLDGSPRRVLSQLGLCYVLPFVLALHLDGVGDLVGVHFSLKASDLRGLDLAGEIVLVGSALLVVGLLGYHFVLARREGILLPYSAAFVAVPSVVALVTSFLRDTHYLHVHHYLYGAFLFPFFRFEPAVSRVAQATFLGICVEGASRWGLDPVWYPRA